MTIKYKVKPVVSSFYDEKGEPKSFTAVRVISPKEREKMLANDSFDTYYYTYYNKYLFKFSMNHIIKNDQQVDLVWQQIAETVYKRIKNRG